MKALFGNIMATVLLAVICMFPLYAEGRAAESELITLKTMGSLFFGRNCNDAF